MPIKPAIAALILSIGAPAIAAPVTLSVVGADGRPVAGAVVTLDVPGASAAIPRGPYVMAQHNIAFEPHVIVVPVGASVSFPNLDKVRHHVYSFSPTKRFDLKLYGHDETRSVVFDKPGVVALGCNIHDAMSGFIYVAATPYAAVTDAAGRIAIDVPAGKAVLHIWHPSIRAPGNMLSQPATIPASGFSGTFGLKR
ncbi:MAG: methylamine utilization protein [Pseudomonadota bacterium]|nr:methylamine utilization protein [Pseudomonadota bacterium]